MLLLSAASCHSQTRLGKQWRGSALHAALCSLRGHGSTPWYNAEGFVRSMGCSSTSLPGNSKLELGAWGVPGQAGAALPLAGGFTAFRSKPVTWGKAWGEVWSREDDLGRGGGWTVKQFFCTNSQVWANAQCPEGRLTNRLGLRAGLFCTGWGSFLGSVAFILDSADGSDSCVLPTQDCGTPNTGPAGRGAEDGRGGGGVGGAGWLGARTSL